MQKQLIAYLFLRYCPRKVLAPEGQNPRRHIEVPASNMIVRYTREISVLSFFPAKHWWVISQSNGGGCSKHTAEHDVRSLWFSAVWSVEVFRSSEAGKTSKAVSKVARSVDYSRLIKVK